MMQAIIYTIRDTKSEGFTRPSFFVTEEMAVRSFSFAVDGGDQAMTDFPDDYTLYRIGVWNDETGMIEGHDVNRVITGIEALQMSKRRKAKLEALNVQIEQLKNGEDVEHAQ